MNRDYLGGTLSERFWAKVDKTDSCWNWIGGKDAGGYGLIRGNHTGNRMAHRIAYELLVAPIPEGLELDHLCRNRGCVNPAHLEPVTHAVNLSRGKTIGAFNSSKTHCKRGHPLSGPNLYMRPDGGRQCRTCTRMHMDAFYARRRAAKEVSDA